jgi:hypothetical protein
MSGMAFPKLMLEEEVDDPEIGQPHQTSILGTKLATVLSQEPHVSSRLIRQTKRQIISVKICEIR